MTHLMWQMWLLLLLAFLLGLAVYHWLTGKGAQRPAEENVAELAAARTRHQECEADRARLKARAAELAMQLEDGRKQVESANARANEFERERERLEKALSTAAADPAALAALQKDASEAAVLRARLAKLEATAAEAESLRKRVAHLEIEAREAASLRARLSGLEREAAAAPALRDRLAAAQREGEAAEALRVRVADLERRLAAAESAAKAASAAPISPLAGAHAAAFDDDAAALRRRVRELEEALDDLRARPVAAEPAPAPSPSLSGGQGQGFFSAPQDAPPTVEPAASTTPEDDGGSPTFLSGPIHGSPDDLQKIKGVGPKLEKTLHDLGVYYYRQVAAWSDAQVAEVDAQLIFKGRIDRDDWRGQAKILAEGGATEFSERYARGDTGKGGGKKG